jgi:hypothetical protein
VYQHGQRGAVVTAAARTRASTVGPADVPIATVMDCVAVPVKPEVDAIESIRTFDHAIWDWLEHH